MPRCQDKSSPRLDRLNVDREHPDVPIVERENGGHQPNAWNAGETAMRELPVTLPSLNIATIKVPERMSELDFTTLMNSLAAWKDALVQSAAESNEPPELAEDS